MMKKECEKEGERETAVSRQLHNDNENIKAVSCNLESSSTTPSTVAACNAKRIAGKLSIPALQLNALP